MKNPNDEHATAVRRASLAIGVSIFAGVLIGSWVSRRMVRRWSESVNLLADASEAVDRLRSDVRGKVRGASDVGELTTIAMDAISQQRERRRDRDGRSV